RVHLILSSLQFTMVETVTTALADQFEWMRQRKTLVVVTTCVIIFLMGLTMCLEGGIFMFELFFFYSAGVSVIMLGILQLLGVQYVYGTSVSSSLNIGYMHRILYSRFSE
ncbi:hypothetical protein OTU49_017516, partial [Cherax quadricarinatus]